MSTNPGGAGGGPPGAWERLLRRAVPPGTVGRSIVGDLREEHARRAGLDPAAAGRWYRREALGIAARAALNRLLGRWAGDPRLAPGGHGGRGGGDPMFERVLRSLRYAARSLVRAPRFTVISVVTVALGVGAATAVFSVVNGVLLRPLDYPDSDELVDVWSSAPGLGYQQFGVSPDIYFFYRSECPAFADMASFSQQEVSITGEEEPERVGALVATSSLFTTLKVPALLGRTYTADEDRPGAPLVAVLSYELWQRRFGGDSHVIGKAVDIEGEPREIIGVMPPGFDFPRNVQIWLPARMDPDNPPMGRFSFLSIARLAPGVSADQAQAQLVPLVQRIIDSRVDEYKAFLTEGKYAPLVHVMKEDRVGSLERPLWILLGTVGIVLLIACANVANLVLIRAEVRRRESAVRTALGATHGTLIRQSAAESMLLAVCGGALGLLVAWVGVPAILRHAPPQLPRLGEVGVDGTVLLFTLGVTALSALLFGVAPLLRRNPSALLGALKQGGRGGTAAARKNRGRNVLVAGQTALALVLLVGSGLLVRSFEKARGTDLGFDYHDLLTFRLSLPAGKYPTPSQVTAFHEELTKRLEALPGVESAGLTSAMPLAQGMPGTAFAIADRPTAAGKLPPMLHFAYISTDYVNTLRIPVLSGRGLQRSDVSDGAGHVLVDKALAARIWPGEDPIGKRLRPSGDTLTWYSVEGVVAQVRDRGVRLDPQPMVYFPLEGPAGDGGWSVRSATYAVRSRTPGAMARAIRSTVWSVDPTIPVADLRTGDELAASSVLQLSFTMFTLGIAALLALVLGAVGLYGVLSYSVAQRTQEIGVRMALGAERSSVARMVVGDGAKITAVGLLVGLAVAAALTRLLQEILFGVKALDPVTFGGTALLLLGVAVLASYIPARKAAAVDPMKSIRVE